MATKKPKKNESKAREQVSLALSVSEIAQVDALQRALTGVDTRAAALRVLVRRGIDNSPELVAGLGASK